MPGQSRLSVDQLLLDHVYDTQHIVGGCRMGADDDASAVVDPTCRVMGVDRLRVIDGSVFPTCPRANTFPRWSGRNGSSASARPWPPTASPPPRRPG